MERLTENNKCKLSHGEEIVLCKHCENDCNDSCMKIIHCKWYTKAMDKLKRYEDLEERLNKVYGDCDGLLESMIELLEEHSGVDIPDDTVKVLLLSNKAVDFYKECEDLDVRDRLIKLPCKDVYFINPRHTMVMKKPIRELKIYETEDIDRENCKYFSTEEKAKVKLKELRGGKNE